MSIDPLEHERLVYEWAATFCQDLASGSAGDPREFLRRRYVDSGECPEKIFEAAYRRATGTESATFHLNPAEGPGTSRLGKILISIRAWIRAAAGRILGLGLRRIGKYRILGKPLGKGGQGIVYRVRGEDGKLFAAKVLTDLSGIVRFRREARVLMNFNHPGICKIVEWSETGRPHIVMELIDGKSLKEWTVPGADHEVRSTIRMIARAAEALHLAHEAGIVHRDIKRSNLMVRADGQPVILDFGIASDEHRAGETLTGNQQPGSGPYRSPEQVRNESDLDRRTDVWSLGVTLYELLTGELPFLSGPAIEQDPIPEITLKNPVVPESISEFLAHVLAKERSLRYRTAEEFAANLENVLNHAPIAGPTEDLAAYRQYLQDRHRTLLPFFNGVGDVLLEEVFVEVAIEEAMSEDDLGLTRNDRKAHMLPHEEARRKTRWLLEDYLEEQEKTLAGQERTARTLLLGEPGSGKTTVVRHLVLRRAAAGCKALPVFISLARLAEKIVHPFAAAQEEYRKSPLSEAEPLIQRFKALSKRRGGLWLFLDGLDEVRPDRMHDVREWIRALDGELKDAAITVSTRPVAVERQGLSRWFKNVMVQPLDSDAQTALLEKLLGREEGSIVREELERSPALAEMARNPLLLTLIGFVGREAGALGRRLPVRRVKLYQEVLDVLLRRGHCPEPRGMVDPALARRVLRELSLRLQGQGGESWAEETLDQELWSIRRSDEDLSFQIEKTWKSNANFLEDCGHNSGVLGPHDGPGVPWRYLHRTLREFLAAEGLLAAGPNGIATWLTSWISAERSARERMQGPRRRAEGQEQAETRAAAEPARWGEVYGLLCGLVDDPLPHLRTLRAADPGLASRALRSVEGLSPVRAIGFVLEDARWDEDDVLVLVRDAADRDAMEAALMAHVRPESSTRTLAIVWYALETMDRAPVRQEFFERCGRWPKGGPPEIEASPIPAGRFRMGSPEGQGDPDEHPQHEVILTSPFRLGWTPVMVGEFKNFEGDHPGSERYEEGEADDWPVVNTSWYEARLFAAWVGGRLPTEAEWEYAGRGGTATRWWAGDTEADLRAVGWFRDNSDYSRHPVGKPPTPLGLEHPNKLLDLHGNVLEWCDDGMREYRSEALTDPRGPTGQDIARVFRGGSFRIHAVGCRSAFRSRNVPRLRRYDIGFRVALPAPCD